MANEGEFPKIDGDILYGSEVNGFNAIGYKTINYIGGDCLGLLAHSATTWTAYNGTSTLRTTDAGATWGATSADIADMTGPGTVCDADNTKAIICAHDSADISISSDSGDNWASASVDPANITKVWDISFPTAAVAVVACDIGASARSIFYSTDAGDNWTICTSGPAVDCMVIDMVDANDGIAIDVNDNIWTTNDGGNNWSDSGQNSVGVTATGMSSMIALTSTTYAMVNHDAKFIETGNTTSGGTQRLNITDAGPAIVPSNLIKANNGFLYFAIYYYEGATAVASNVLLYKSKDNGVTWQVIPLPLLGHSDDTFITNNFTKALLQEYTTNKIILSIENQVLMLIDESWST